MLYYADLMHSVSILLSQTPHVIGMSLAAGIRIAMNSQKRHAVESAKRGSGPLESAFANVCAAVPYGLLLAVI